MTTWTTSGAGEGVPWASQPEVTWSVRVQDVATGNVLLEHQAGVVLPTASIGKILLLLTVADLIARGALPASKQVSRAGLDPTADSGVWQHLELDALSVFDAARLVAAVSDNLATNALVTLVGLETIAATAASLGLDDTALHDIVRDERTAQHPPALSTGSAAELVGLCVDIELGRAVSAPVSEMVRGWLRLDTDLSMVAAPFGLDPLAHVEIDRGVLLWNKTGTNVGVRCDVGVLRGSAPRGEAAIAYAALAHWQPTSASDPVRDHVLATMREIGSLIRTHLR